MIIIYSQQRRTEMLTDQLKADFKKDLIFSGWTDALGLKLQSQVINKSTQIIGQKKVLNKKIQIIISNGVNIRFMIGNKIESTTYWAGAVKDNSFESKVTDFLGLPFAQGRQVYRSIMAIVASTI